MNVKTAVVAALAVSAIGLVGASPAYAQPPPPDPTPTPTAPDTGSETTSDADSNSPAAAGADTFAPVDRAGTLPFRICLPANCSVGSAVGTLTHSNGTFKSGRATIRDNRNDGACVQMAVGWYNRGRLVDIDISQKVCGAGNQRAFSFAPGDGRLLRADGFRGVLSTVRP